MFSKITPIALTLGLAACLAGAASAQVGNANRVGGYSHVEQARILQQERGVANPYIYNDARYNASYNNPYYTNNRGYDANNRGYDAQNGYYYDQNGNLINANNGNVVTTARRTNNRYRNNRYINTPIGPLRIGL